MRIVFRYWVASLLATAAFIVFTGMTSSAQTYKLGTISRNASSSAVQLVARNTPSYIVWAKNLGPANTSTIMDVSVWLNLRNRAGLDQLASSLYQRGSPNYHHWVKPVVIAAQFGPTAQQAKLVEQFLMSHNLSIVTEGPNNFYVRARGTVGQVEAAFRTQLNYYQLQNKVVRANASDPSVDAAVAPFVQAVSGLDTGEYHHPFVARPSGNPKTHGSYSALSMSTPNFFTANCFPSVTTQTFTGPANSYPKGTYTGNDYVGNPRSPGCGYTPPEIAKAFNLNGLYAQGYRGDGQTIAIIDWCGSPTIRGDANAFSARFGLPLLTPSTFGIIQVPIPSQCAAPDPEINIDVEWSHAIAPDADINLIVPPSASFQDVDEAEFYAVNYGLGTVLSGSYASIESFTPPSVLDTENLINEIAAIAGISADFSSGDDGDYTLFGIPATVSAPADSPWATAVGGTTLALKPNGSIDWQSGWGNNETLLADEGYIPDPPLAFGFVYGSGGGPSGFFAKPAFQKGVGVPGAYRQLPDISWLADPFTGGVIAITVPFQFPPLVWEVYGGTSLSCPMFSGLWAIANQEAGVPLGQAAPYVYHLPAAAITDIVPVTSPHNVTAVIHDSPTVTHSYNAFQVMDVSEPFYSAIWDYPLYQDVAYAVSFGTDSGLRTHVGWDNVTGVGTPNGKAFADAFKP